MNIGFFLQKKNDHGTFKYFVEKKKFCRERFLPTEILLHLLLHSSLPCFTVFNSLLSVTIVLEIQNKNTGEHMNLQIIKCFLPCRNQSVTTKKITIRGPSEDY